MRPPSWFLASALAVAACTGPKMAPYTPLDQETELDKDKLFEAAEGTLLDRGYLIDDKDQAAGKLVTKERTMLGSQIAQEKFKYVWTVEVGGGHVKLQIGCKQTKAEDIASCGDEVPEKLVKEQQEIADQIVREAGGG